MKTTLRDFLVSLSLANFVLLTSWWELLLASSTEAYWLPSYTAASYMAALLNLFGIAGLLWLSSILVRSSNNRVLDHMARTVFLLMLIFPANYYRLTLGVNESTVHWLQETPFVAVPLGLIVGVSAVYFVFISPYMLSRFVAVLLLIFVPLVAVTAGQAAWKAVELSNAEDQVKDRVKVPIPDASSPVKQRVLVLLMDELDLRLAFTGKAKGIELPEFDRFRSQALFSWEAYSHSKNTREAVPSILSGTVMRQVKPSGIGDFEVLPEHQSEAGLKAWREFPNLFKQARDFGARTAIIGYYHPYCRIFIHEYEFCTWFSVNTYAFQASDSLFGELYSQWLGNTLLFKRINGVRTFRAIQSESLAMAPDSRYDLVYIHASIPHGPNIYDRKSNRLTLFKIGKDGYFDNLVLADRYLGQVRRAMEANGTWESTAILITSDHEWRHVYLYDSLRVRKVPYVLKMPGQTEGEDFREPFSAFQVTRELVLEIMSGRLSRLGEVVEWLQAKSG